MLLGTFYYILNTALAAWLGLRWSRRLLPEASLAERTLSALVLFTSLATLSLLLVGIAGVLYALSVFVLLVVLVLVELFALRKPKPVAPQPITLPSSRWNRLALVIGIFIFGYTAWEILSSGSRFGWDTLSYHGVTPAWWLQERSLALAHFNFQGYYAMNVELMSLWFMLPHGIDAHANMSGLVWLSVALAAFWVHARRLSYIPVLAAAAAACFFLSPTVEDRLAYFTNGDLALAAMLTAMIAFTWVPKENARPRARALLSGLAGGLALGMKPTAAPYILLIGLAWLARTSAGSESERSSGKLERLAAFGFGVLLLGSFWYFRNLYIAGNPLFPASIGPFGGPLGAEARYDSSLMRIMMSEWNSPDMWTLILGKYLDRPLVIGILSIVGYGVGLFAFFRSKDPKRRQHLLLILGCGLLFCLLFPTQPFSGTVNRPVAKSIYLVRYITFSFLIGLLLLPAFWRSKLAGGSGSDGTSASPSTSSPRKNWVSISCWSAGLIVLLGLGLTTKWRSKATTEYVYSYHGRISAIWKSLESLPANSGVAVFCNDPPSHHLIYPLFGRRYKLRPIPIAWDGSLRQPLHERWSTDPPEWFWEFDAHTDLDEAAILANLRTAGVDFLLLIDDPVRPRSDQQLQRKLGLQMISKLNRKRCRLRGGGMSLWDLRGLPTQPIENASDPESLEPGSKRK